jgi:hypothetical protein
MEEGFLLGRLPPTSWFEGKQEKGFLGLVKVCGKRQRPVEAFRCTKCGRIELYARAQGRHID